MANDVTINITDNSSQVVEALQDACLRALEICGLAGEGYAKMLCPVDTGNLRNSITHRVDEAETAAYIGAPIFYSAFVELGTVKQAAQPYLKPAVADHVAEYESIIKNELTSG